MIRLLTRDYLDVLRCVLLTDSSAANLNQVQPEEDEMMDGAAANNTVQSASHIPVLGDLGKAVLADRSLSRYLLEW